MHIIYRISDSGYNKIKPDYINNENCLRNALNTFPTLYDTWSIIADNISQQTNDMIQKYISRDHIYYTDKGNGAATFNLALDEALKLDDNEIVYFIENDYVHKSGSPYILQEGFEIGADYITLYCHPDKFLPPSQGGNPYVGEDGGYNTKIYKSKSCFWLMTESTTMTFAAKVKTLKEDEDILRKWTSGIHPDDFKMFLDLRVKGKALLMPIPSYSTHGEVQWLAPFENWKEIIK